MTSLQESLYFAKMEIEERMEHEAITTENLKKSDEEKRKLATDAKDLQVCACVCMCACVYVCVCVCTCVHVRMHACIQCLCGSMQYMIHCMLF